MKFGKQFSYVQVPGSFFRLEPERAFAFSKFPGSFFQASKTQLQEMEFRGDPLLIQCFPDCKDWRTNNTEPPPRLHSSLHHAFCQGKSGPGRWEIKVSCLLPVFTREESPAGCC